MAGRAPVFAFCDSYIPQCSTSDLTPVIAPVCQFDVKGTRLPVDFLERRGIQVTLLARARNGRYVENVRVLMGDLEETFRQTRPEYRKLCQIEGRCEQLRCEVCNKRDGGLASGIKGGNRNANGNRKLA